MSPYAQGMSGGQIVQLQENYFISKIQFVQIVIPKVTIVTEHQH